MTKPRKPRAKKQFKMTVELFDKIQTVEDLILAEIEQRKRLAFEAPVVPKVVCSVKWPKTWWQHFKQDCFPAWAKERWPVQLEERSWAEDAPKPSPTVRIYIPNATTPAGTLVALANGEEPVGTAIDPSL